MSHGFIRQTVQLQAGKLAHGLNFIQGGFRGRIAQVIEQLHIVNAPRGGQRIRRLSVLALGVITGYLLLQLLPQSQFVHPPQKNLATGFALFGLILGFGDGGLIHAGNDPMRLTAAVLSVLWGVIQALLSGGARINKAIRQVVFMINSQDCYQPIYGSISMPKAENTK